MILEKAWVDLIYIGIGNKFLIASAPHLFFDIVCGVKPLIITLYPSVLSIQWSCYLLKS